MTWSSVARSSVAGAETGLRFFMNSPCAIASVQQTTLRLHGRSGSAIASQFETMAAITPAPTLTMTSAISQARTVPLVLALDGAAGCQGSGCAGQPAALPPG